MSEAAVLERGISQLKRYLQRARPDLKVKQTVEPRTGSSAARPDAVLTIGGVKIFIEAKSVGEPRYIRDAALQLRRYLDRESGGFGVVIAPYISQRGADVVKDAELSYLDLSGNSYLQLPGVYVEVEGRESPVKSSKELRNLFAPVSSRFHRALLTQPERRWLLKELAEETGMSLGQAFKVKKRLLDEALLEEEVGGRFYCPAPGRLLELWRDKYMWRENQLIELFSMDRVNEIEQRIADTCARKGWSYGYTLFTASSRVVPFVRYNIVAFYFGGPISELLELADVKKVDSGPNVYLLVPYDDGVFYRSEAVGGIDLANTVQVYLDLYSFRGRGKEQADALRDEVLRY